MADFPTCKLCRYWQANDSTEFSGECRYALPTLGVDPWPITESTDWCREWIHHSTRPDGKT